MNDTLKIVLHGITLVCMAGALAFQIASCRNMSQTLEIM